MTNNRIRVLHIVECNGGVGVFLKSLFKYTDRSKIEIILVCSNLYNTEEYDELVDSIEVMEIPHGLKMSSLKSIIIFRKLVKQYKPDIVCAHSSIAGAISRLACGGLTVKIVYNPHGWAFNIESRMRKLYLIFERIMAITCDRIVCISEAEKKSALCEKICRENKLIVINNGIDMERIIGNCPLNIPDDVCVVGMVGRICKQKASDVFVKMANVINGIRSGVIFIIVGDVLESDIQEKRDIERFAFEHGIDLIITGWVDNPLDYVSRFDVGCLLSRWEGFGLVLPEYMYCGVPIVATRVDAIPYIVKDGVTGYLVDKDDYNSAAMKVIDAIGNRELVENERKEVIKYDMNRVANEYDNMFVKMMGY